MTFYYLAFGLTLIVTILISFLFVRVVTNRTRSRNQAKWQLLRQFSSTAAAILEIKADEYVQIGFFVGLGVGMVTNTMGVMILAIFRDLYPVRTEIIPSMLVMMGVGAICGVSTAHRISSKWK